MRSAVAAFALIVGLASVAVAGPKEKAKADALFKQGKQLLAAKKYADACKAFEASQELDPAIGTQLNLALCFEEWGKLLTAQLAYLEAEKQAAQKNDKRAAAARQRADALVPRIPRIVFDVPTPAPPDLVVTVDGKEVAPDVVQAGLPVDPGPHTIAYRFGSAPATEAEEKLEEAEVQRVRIEAPTPREPPEDTEVGLPPDPPPARSVSRGRSRRILGLVMAGAGVAITGAGGYIALSARSDYRDAFAMHCSDVDNSCDDTGYEATNDARSKAHIGTGLFIGGLAVLAGGVVVYLTAPKGSAPADESALYLTPVVGADGGGLAIGGRL